MDENTAAKLRGLQKAYAIFSPLTNMPYVECEEENYNDRVLLFEGKEEAEAAAEELEEKGIRTTVTELKTVEIAVPAGPNKKPQKMYLNQVRQHLSILPQIGVNAVGFKPEGKEMETVETESVLPDNLLQKISGTPAYQPNLQLTGLYLMQEARRKKEYVDMKHLQELDEEFCSNLAKSRLFIAVLPPEGREKEEKLNLKECRLPYLKHQNGDIFFPVFTDISEFQKYAKNNRALRMIQIPFAELLKLWVKDAKAYMVNPMGFSLPLSKEMIPRITERFGTGGGIRGGSF